MRRHDPHRASVQAGRALLAACLVFLLAPAVWATDETPPPPVCPFDQMCIDVVEECDAGAAGSPFTFRGTVRNCGSVWFDEVRVEDANDATLIFSSINLAPGASVSYESSFTPAECPAIHSTVVKGKINTGDNNVSCRVKDFADSECDCSRFDEICRTPGFWGTHAGVEKDGSSNITQAVIDAGTPPGIQVCGVDVTNTLKNQDNSALEAMCVHPRAAQVLQLTRQLTAMALNCVVSGSTMDCDGTSVASLFSDCDLACVDGTDDAKIGSCIAEVDCWNNGGQMLDNGMCKLGTCGGDAAAPCNKDADCGLTDEGLPVACIPLQDTCHDRDLVNEGLGLFFEPPGPAGSSKACNDAIKNDCNLLDCN